MINPFSFFSPFGFASQSRPEDKARTAELERILAEQQKNEEARRERMKQNRRAGLARHDIERAPSSAREEHKAQ